MSATNYLEDVLLDYALDTLNFDWIVLHVGDPGEAGTANPAGETTRQQVTWAAASAGSKAATGTPVASWTSVSTTETYTHFSVADASTAGNRGVYGALSASVAVTAGDDFDLDSLSVTLD